MSYRVLIPKSVYKQINKLRFFTNLPHKGVIRLEDCKPQLQIRYLNTVLKKHMDEVPNGIIVAGRVRVLVGTRKGVERIKSTHPSGEHNKCIPSLQRTIHRRRGDRFFFFQAQTFPSRVLARVR